MSPIGRTELISNPGCQFTHNPTFFLRMLMAMFIEIDRILPGPMLEECCPGRF
jgi:hypothetical protein